MEENLLEFKYKNISKDYELLFELIQTQRIICFVKYRDKSNLYDICATSRRTPKDHIDISSRGVSYISSFAFNGKTMKEDFMEQCKAIDLSFLVPQKDN